MNGSRRPWITGGLLALALLLATSGGGTARAQVVLGGGGWYGPGPRWSTWGVSSTMGTGMNPWGIVMSGPGLGPGWIEPVPLSRPAVFPSSGHFYTSPVVMPAPVMIQRAPVMIQRAPVMVRPAPMVIQPTPVMLQRRPVMVRPTVVSPYYVRRPW